MANSELRDKATDSVKQCQPKNINDQWEELFDKPTNL